MDRKTPLVLVLPLNGDPILNRIDSLGDHLYNDESGEYLDELMVVLLNWASIWDAEADAPIKVFERKLEEARFWLHQHCDSIKKDSTEPSE